MPCKVGIIDYGLGNTGSIANMLRKIGAEPLHSKERSPLSQCQALVLGGVGSFDKGMANLQSIGGKALLEELVFEKNIPILGICLGMQLFAKGSEEGNQEGLGWWPASVRRFQFEQGSPFRVPHMGWNYLDYRQPAHALFSELPEDPRFYFTHSYYLQPETDAICLASSAYGIDFCSVGNYKNSYGVQFHPEKSHRFGQQLLHNFIHLCQHETA